MDTQNFTPSDPQSGKLCDEFTLDVVIQGCFVYALKIDSDADAVVGIDVYAPACGHIYSGGIPGQWNNPYFPDTVPPSPDPLLFMLQPRTYCLELLPKVSRNLSASGLKGRIGNSNLWPSQQRPLGQGWDLAVSLPVPDGIESWNTDYMDVSDCFGGDESENFTNMGMVQTLTYKHVSGFKLRGSPLPVETPIPDSNGNVTFVINAEPPCVPSIEHQSMATTVMAQMVGMDLYLKSPLMGSMGNTTEPKGILKNGRAGGCMGGTIFQQPGN